MESLLDRLIGFVAEQAGVERSEISLSTTLQSRLKIHGYDAEEFMAQFAERFGVDIADFHFGRHFIDEESMFMAAYLEPQCLEISVADLLRAAESKRWTYAYPE